MSPIQAGDLLLVQRDGTQYKVLAEDLRAPVVGDELWTPADLPDLEIWFDAEDDDKIVLNGQRVVQWEAKGRAALVASQGAGSRQPLRETINGKKWINSTSLAEGLWSRTIGACNVRNLSIVCILDGQGTPEEFNGIFNIRVAANNTPYLTSSISRPGGTNVCIDVRSIESNSMVSAKHNYASLSSAQLADLNNFSIGFDFGLNTSFCMASFANPIAVPANESIAIASDVDADILRERGFVTGKIAHVICASLSLSSDNIEKLEGWSAHQYGLTALLPADHPYKTAPPTKPTP